jgi:hypothetical protein
VGGTAPHRHPIVTESFGNQCSVAQLVLVMVVVQMVFGSMCVSQGLEGSSSVDLHEAGFVSVYGLSIL